MADSRSELHNPPPCRNAAKLAIFLRKLPDPLCLTEKQPLLSLITETDRCHHPTRQQNLANLSNSTENRNNKGRNAQTLKCPRKGLQTSLALVW